MFSHDVAHITRWSVIMLMNELSRDMTKPTKWHVRPAKTQISLVPRLIRVFAVRLKKAWVLSDPMSASEDSDQTWRMPRLIWVFAGCTVILLVLSWGGSIIALLICNKDWKLKLLRNHFHELKVLILSKNLSSLRPLRCKTLTQVISTVSGKA